MTITEKYAAISCKKTRAESINKLLQKLAKTETDKELRIAIKESIKTIRTRVLGHTIKEVKAIVMELLNDYYTLETADLIALSGVHENQMNFVLQIMEEQNLIEKGKRRRWHEPGKHYNDLWGLKK
jgi:hypothetical protein